MLLKAALLGAPIVIMSLVLRTGGGYSSSCLGRSDVSPGVRPAEGRGYGSIP